MSDCMYVKRVVEEEVQSPIEQFLTRAEQFCEEIRQWVQEEMEQPVARLEEQTQRVCQSWPWPLNWLCSAVTTLIVVIVKVIVLVVKLVAYTVCKTVMIVTRVVITVIVRVLKYLGVLVCAIGSGQWAEAGHALGGLWTSLIDAVEDITRSSIKFLTNVTKDVVGAVLDIVGDLFGLAFNFICSFPAYRPQEQAACRQRFEGVFRGFEKTANGVIDAVASIADGVALLGSGIVRFFDTEKISEGLVKIVFGGTFAVQHSFRFGTGLSFADGYREVAQTTEFMNCVESLIKELVPEE